MPNATVLRGDRAPFASVTTIRARYEPAASVRPRRRRGTVNVRRPALRRR
jgi:hypothetical protein